MTSEIKKAHVFHVEVRRLGRPSVLLHYYYYYSLPTWPQYLWLDCRTKFVELPRLPVGVDGADKLVLFPILTSLGRSLGRFRNAVAPDINISVEMVARVQPSVSHNDHDVSEGGSCAVRGETR